MSLNYEPASEPLHISEPQTLTPKPHILDPQPDILNHKPSTPTPENTRISIELVTSDRKLKASREGSK